MSEASKTQKPNEIKDFRFPPPKKGNVVKMRFGGRIRKSSVLIPVVATAVAYELRHRRVVSLNVAAGAAVAAWAWWFLQDVEGVI